MDDNSVYYSFNKKTGKYEVTYQGVTRAFNTIDEALDYVDSLGF